MTRLTIAAIALLSLAAAPAMAQRWTSDTFGNSTTYRGTDSQGGTWRGTSDTFGNSTTSRFTGPNGQTLRCTSDTFGGSTTTRCN